MKEDKIYVFYIGISHLTDDDNIEDFINHVKSKILPDNLEGTILFIPIQGYNSKVECINPKYITDEELIREHRNLIEELNEHLKLQKHEYIQKNKKTKE